MHLRVTVRNHSVQSDLMKIWGLESQHFINALPIDFVCSSTDLFRRPIAASKGGFDKLLAVFVKQVKCLQVGARRYFDQLGKPVSYLGRWQCAKKGKVEEGVDRCMICAESVFVVTIIDCNFNRNRSVNQSDDRSWNADEIGVPAVCCTGKPICRWSASAMIA